MKLQILGRKVHYWLAITVALPALVIFASGVLLQLKKQVAWIQPTEQRGTGSVPEISFERILAACRTVPQARVRSWDDINRLDVRPSKGMLKVFTRSNWEIQLDTSTSQVLQVAYRRSDLIESIHDGSWFHPLAKLGVFLPAGIVLFVMLATGVYMFWLPIVVKARRRRGIHPRRRSVAA